MTKLRAIHFLDPDYTKKIKEALKNYEFNIDRNSWWSLHGELAEKVGTDRATIINLKNFPELMGETIKWGNIRSDSRAFVDIFIDSKEMKAHGIFPVVIDGVDEECIGYFWIENNNAVLGYDSNYNYKSFKTWEQHGLVCLKSDIKSCEEAERLYHEHK